METTWALGDEGWLVTWDERVVRGRIVDVSTQVKAQVVLEAGGHPVLIELANFTRTKTEALWEVRRRRTLEIARCERDLADAGAALSLAIQAMDAHLEAAGRNGDHRELEGAWRTLGPKQ